MPIYEFRCHSCSHVFDQLCSTGVDAAELACPECDGPVVRKFSLFRAGGFGPDDDKPRTQSTGGCSTCATQSCSTCSVL